MPQYLPAYDLYMSKTHGHHFNMFVMKKELLQHYCTWLFDILFELERELDMTGYTVNDRRVFGFVSERLLDAWLTTNNISFEELSIVYMEHQNWLHKGTAFLKRKFFPKKMLDARNVTAIVVTYNRLPLLKQCLAALRAQTVQGFTVLLVDNASTDGTADYIKTLTMPGLVCRNPGKTSAVRAALPTASAPRRSWGVRPSGSWTTTRCPSRTRWPPCWPPMPPTATAAAGCPAGHSPRTAPTSR